jgi:hypothetical protein
MEKNMIDLTIEYLDSLSDFGIFKLSKDLYQQEVKEYTISEVSDKTKHNIYLFMLWCSKHKDDKFYEEALVLPVWIRAKSIEEFNDLLEKDIKTMGDFI